MLSEIKDGLKEERRSDAKPKRAESVGGEGLLCLTLSFSLLRFLCVFLLRYRFSMVFTIFFMYKHSLSYTNKNMFKLTAEAST